MNSIVDFIGYFLVLIGGVVMASWQLGLDILTRLHPDWVSMKYTTALCFVLCGFLVLSAHRARKKESNNAGILVIGNAFFILFFMFHHSMAFITKDPRLTEFLIRSCEPVKTIIPGLPSPLTIMCFDIVAFWGFAYIISGFRIKRYRLLFSAPIAAISLFALYGYFMGIPAYYGYIPYKFTGMAVHTSIGFLLLSFALYRLSCEDCCFNSVGYHTKEHLSEQIIAEIVQSKKDEPDTLSK